ncbi:hypothetical protein HY413_01635 [Candidatus Kaiserbacteria bacterium]|nr:hypothetical protein [Candidatus Kaiserbacteria bacterium]
MLMKYSKKSLGQPVMFLLPSPKLKNEWENGKKVEVAVEEYLLATFGAYTAAAGHIFGEWRDPHTGKVFYGDHREYSVAFEGRERQSQLEKFLAVVARVIDEKCIYMIDGAGAWFIYPEEDT